MHKARAVFLAGVVLVLLAAFFGPVLAQDEIIVTVAIQEWMQDSIHDRALAPFTEAHPGVKVVVVPISDQGNYIPAAYSLDQHLEGAADYAGVADVLLMNNYNFSAISTRAGNFLDLTPLVTTDPNLDEADFFSAVWRAFQWDNGIWALPVTASVQLVIYNADAFDAAGLAYPNENWTMADYIDATYALTQYDGNGEVTTPGMYQFNADLLLRAFLGQPFYDDSIGAIQPRFTSPEMIEMVNQWQQVTQDIFSNISFDRMDYNAIPLIVDQTYRLSNPNQEGNWQAALLPGGTAGLDVQGFAVSAGTPHPEMAYELAKFLTRSPEVVNRFFGDSPARRSMVGVEAEGSAMIIRSQVPQEYQPLLQQALENGLPTSERLFYDYVNRAVSNLSQETADIELTLQEAEAQASSDLETAAALRSTSVVSVATPIPTPVLSGSDIALKFRINASISPLPNRDRWERLIADFTAADSQVRHIELLTNLGQNNQEEEIDCSYSMFNTLSTMDSSNPTLLNLDPFLDADPGFNEADFVSGVFDQLTRDNRVWGIPLTVEPEILWYSPQAFIEAGAIAPQTGWTVDQFADTLQVLRANPGDPTPFQPYYSGNTYLLMLMAAYGAIPYDHRTIPPTINLTDPASMDAMRQVLDLAKNGYIEYRELGNTSGGSFSSTMQMPLIGDMLSLQSWRLQNRSNSDIPNQYLLTTFPVGTQFTPLAYQVGAGYIEANTLNPEACYRWLSFISQHPELFNSMPARISQLNSPEIAAQGEDVVAVFQSLAGLLAAPNSIIFSQYNVLNYYGGWIEQMWLNRAFDRYVLETADLESELSLAEENILLYRDCSGGLPNLDVLGMAQEETLALLRQYAQCAVGIDPSMEANFSFLDQVG